MKLTIFLSLLLLTNLSYAKNSRAKDVYRKIPKLSKKLDFKAFSNAWTGYQKLVNNGIIQDKQILTVIDFNEPSTKKRLFVLDLHARKIIFNTTVSHGKNSGGKFAKHFSNRNNSLKSSLGFYKTGRVYNGRKKRSLKLHGLERGINSNAYKRAIVVHGANYIRENAGSSNGRSWGCFAVQYGKHKKLIELTKNETLIYAHHKNYKSKILAN